LTLTLSDGPRSGSPPETNYDVEGPEHKLLFSDFPRRARGRFEGATVVDTTRGRLLHETGILPVFYAPVEDLDRELLEGTDHSTHCPFEGDVRRDLIDPRDTETVCPYKGTAGWWSLNVDGHHIEDAAWRYPEPSGETLKARDHIRFAGGGVAVEMDGEQVE